MIILLRDGVFVALKHFLAKWSEWLRKTVLLEVLIKSKNDLIDF